MGTNCAPFLANLYLYSYEAEYIESLELTDIAKARGFHMSFRLIDDLLSVDNPCSADFVDAKCNFYPPALRLNETTAPGDVVANFVGMKISIKSRHRCRVRVYDKRADFPFQVRMYPHLRSNIPLSLAYGVFIGQLHRYHRICTNVNDFLRCSIALARKLIAQCYVKRILARRFRVFLSCRVKKYRRPAPLLLHQFLAALRDL